LSKEINSCFTENMLCAV